MTIFLLDLIDAESNQWPNSTYKGEVIARAKDEGQARALANIHLYGADTSTLPCRNLDLVTCETIGDWEGETDGPAKILYHVNHAVPDPRQEAEYLRALAYQAEHQTTNLRKLGVRIYNHLHGNELVETAVFQVADGIARIGDWANELKETGESEHLPLIAAGLRKIANELERQAMQTN